MRDAVLLLPFLLLLLPVAGAGKDDHRWEQPVAPHRAIRLDDLTTELKLPGYDLSGQPLQTTITSLPATGALYQLSYNYNTHGYDPKDGTPITTVPTNVTGTGMRVVYQRPPNPAYVGVVGGVYRPPHPYGPWARFTYTVTGLHTHRTSAPGQVLLLSPTGVMVGSRFDVDPEGWGLVGNHRETQVVYDRTSRGLQSRFVYATEAHINVGSSGTPGQDPDLVLWYFRAPPVFLGNQALAYGGQLLFTLSSFSGDFAPGNVHQDAHVVYLECATCRSVPAARDNSGRPGVRLGIPVRVVFPRGLSLGQDVPVALNLTERAGWVEDSKDSLRAWVPPSRCTFLQVLSRLSGLSILGDYTKYYETMSIDNVAMVANPSGRLPMCAQGSPEAQQCVCQ